MTLTIVTSFNRAIWNNHGKTCVESWVRHLRSSPNAQHGASASPDGGSAMASPPAYELHLYIDGPIPSDLPKGDNIHIHWLDNEPEYVKFLTETRDVTPNPNIPPEHKFRFEFRRFWPKVFSIKHAVDEYMNEWGDSVLWLDADILFKKDLSVERIEDDGNEEDVVCLDRGHPWNYMDSGYLLLTQHNVYDGCDYFQQFVNGVYNVYTTKTIFRFTEWHDAFLMSQVMNILWGKDKDTYVKSLSGLSSSLHPLDDSWLRDYMVHLKGGLKHGVTQSFEGQEIEKQNALAPIEAPRRTDV